MLICNSVIIAAICQMVYLNRLDASDDLTFDVWRVTLCTQIVQCMSILTTCLVYLRPFLDSLETGFIQVGDLRRQQVSGFGYRTEEGSRTGKDSKLGLSFTSLKSRLSRAQPRDEEVELQNSADHVLPSSTNNTANSDGERHEWDAHSRSRILRTTTLTVEERYREQASRPVSPSAQFAHPSEVAK